MKKTLHDIAQIIDAELRGEPQLLITAVSPLDKAEKSHISFINSSKFLSKAKQSQASALIVNAKTAENLDGNLLIVNDPYLAFAKIAQVFDSTPSPLPGIHPSAMIAEDVQLGSEIYVGPNAVVESGAKVGSGSIIEAGVYLGPNCIIGDNCRIYPNTVLYHDVRLGNNCIVHASVVIGSDGFGYANDEGQWVKIPQVGGVVIGNDVEIGAHTAIDRGALEDTEIGNGVILDNHIHVAHNVKIGDYTAIAGCAAIAGSAVIGKYCTIAGRASIIGHITICDNAHVTATTFVNKSITDAGVYSSGTTHQANKAWQKSAVRFRQLDDMWRKMKQLEKELLQLKSNRETDNE